eukprot:scaffold72376_cov63-Phaeocystis_antarctica.AAC.2
MASSHASIRPAKVTYAPCISASACSADVTPSIVCSSCSNSCRLSSDPCRSAWRVAYGSASRASMAGRTDCKRSAKASVLSTSARSSSTMLTTSSRIFAARSSASLSSVRRAASSARSASWPRTKVRKACTCCSAWPSAVLMRLQGRCCVRASPPRGCRAQTSTVVWEEGADC